MNRTADVVLQQFSAKTERYEAVDYAHVSNNDAPAFVERNPGLRHSSDLPRRVRAVEQRRCHRKVATKRGNHGLRKLSGKAHRRACGAKRLDFLKAV